MVIIDEPFASPFLIQWLESTQHPVLANAFAMKTADGGANLNLIDDAQAIALVNSGQRVYTCSENALEWITSNCDNQSLSAAIELCKDKATMREILASFDPDLFYQRCAAADLSSLDFDALPTPFILKPTRGFCSFGVFTINSKADWDAALESLGLSPNVIAAAGVSGMGGEEPKAAIDTEYPESVIDAGEFVLEEYITGQECAVDMFYDGEGKAHILNVLKHDFSSPEDTTDRCYYTSATIIRQLGGLFERWFDQINDVMGMRDFCIHAEVRVEGDKVRPIEFNPLRFAGLGGTDIATFAYGYRTYERYLNNDVPDFDALFAGKEDMTYAMSVMMPEPDADPTKAFDLDAFLGEFSCVLGAHDLDFKKTNAYTFCFMAMDPVHVDAELQFLLDCNCNNYCK